MSFAPEIKKQGRVCYEQLVLQLRLRRKQRDEVYEIAVVRHDFDIRMRPVGAPKHTIGSGFDHLACEGDGIMKRRAGRRDAFAAADLHPAFSVPLQEANESLKRNLIQTL